MMKSDPDSNLTESRMALFSLAPRALYEKISSRRDSAPKMTVTEAKRLQKQIKDFAGGGIALLPQRQAIYIGAFVLCAFFYSFWIALFCYLFCQLTEILDYVVSKRVMEWKDASPRKARRFHFQLLATSTLSSIAVAIFVLLVAKIEGPSEHLASLFFLFAAGLFAAVNNHQLPKVLSVRLLIYSAAFVYVPISDILEVRPPLRSELYLNLATAVFVLFFVLECSMIFLRLYQKGLDQFEELRIERDRANEVAELKSQFVSIVSHELRTPLTSIIGALGLMKTIDSAENPEGFEKILGIASKNGARLSALINDLLDLQKLESNQMSYGFTALDPTDVVQDSVEAISAHADSRGVKVKMEKSDHDLCVSADYDRLIQVVDNLLSNAVKFSDSGDVVTANVVAKGTQAHISVNDEGTGIPEGSNDLVFGKFAQVDGSDHRAHEGTGLGLNIVKQIVQAHGGTVSYESEFGVGTTFLVTLPLCSSEECS
ncbi:HAMP domain-containing sensor histidine kinase [Shimia thalassica]|uniref:sensor histidine kinase n=1 Tax=Shimia thalassica TaxID=1715693 RepID=UPI001C09A061|nr:HAMP domain-containing sensor histidine kinase [Shimia thalassica]MBU2944361.1 HAMP domain-containing histidine kinase [Shimia thalassica]MDO6502294.1 HAMP domain-containing sensor histidine kinase [Shimia thalassica]